MPKKFIQKVLKGDKGKLHKQLGIPQSQTIPTTLLKKIMDSKRGSTIKNPTMTGYDKVPVTKLLKQRANFALTLKKLRKKKKRDSSTIIAGSFA